MLTEKEIAALVDEGLRGTDKFLVALRIKSGNLIRIFIDGDTAVAIDDCVKLSRFLETRLDRNIEDFELQVSSSGADQPLLQPRQYFKHIGRTLQVRTMDENLIVGSLEMCAGEGITLKEKSDKKKKEIAKTVFIEFKDIKESKIELSFK